MSLVINKTREILLEKCRQHKEHVGYDYWNDHIKKVVEHALYLADLYGADKEIVELGALLHDISMPAEYGSRSAHYVYSADMAEQLLTDLNYPQNKIERVVKCVYNHSGRNQHLRTTIEEHCVADGDALAHFDRIPSLFSLAYNLHGMSLEEGREYVKKRLQNDFSELSEQTKEMFRKKYETIMEVVFVE
ncbi:MAG TPA: HD domain-containing protein [Clostridia bacterium]|jgi:uncharacterized protein|nr:MAG: tRNA 2'-O-methylase [Firmicutes bacterium ADurb.Bin099]HNZ41454.1 HD domain-containing protein [Clostridia bacterium]HPY98438.1 HD domain-containing protein [Clostridia bacterium]HQC68316.1 HD domain-containing protein [Clostridia bacterium]